MTSGRVFALGALGFSLLSGAARTSSAEPAAPSRSPSKAECAAAYESAQESRASAQLRRTLEKLQFCAQPECPSFVQRDCTRWLGEVQRELPSVRITARNGDGSEVSDVHVTLDGEPLPEGSTGVPIPLDPGRHELVFERNGHAPVTRTIVAQQGVQDRTLVVELGGDRLSALEADRPEAPLRPLRPYAFAAWGLGAVGLGAFAVLGTIGRSDRDALADDCPMVTADAATAGPGICLQADVDDRNSSIDRTFMIADVGLVVGLIGLVGGTVLYFLPPSDSAAAASDGARYVGFDVQMLRGGARATLNASF